MNLSRPSLTENSAYAGLFRSWSGTYKSHKIPLRVLEWSRDNDPNDERLDDVPSLRWRPQCDLRVIFAPLDLANKSGPSNGHGILSLCEHYNIPPRFLSERLYSITNSFGTQTSEGTEASWMHFLCKAITLEENSGGPTIIDPMRADSDRWDEKSYPKQNTPNRTPFSWKSKASGATVDEPEYTPSQNHTWHRSAYFLRSHSVPHDSKHANITLICFEAPQALEYRLAQLKNSLPLDDVLADPFILYSVILEALYDQMNGVKTSLKKVFGDRETNILIDASRRMPDTSPIDFFDLHHIAKHVIYIQEGFSAILETIKKLRAHHEQSVSNTSHRNSTDEAIAHWEGMFTSARLQLESMEKRTNNLIGLSFNLVMQQDSRTMQRDSSSMNIIAVVTMIFLPLTAVSSIFGSQFFNTGSSGHIKLSQDFWIMWVVTVPCTVIVIWAWRAWCAHQAQKLTLRGRIKAPAELRPAIDSRV